ncbi:MAG: ASPIC/UnbV domain-containing protein [Verrucomicrobia bacterium]|nr:ASPIC/UnbV domain-containing protein [Verrucomicrobiota bacterium]
MAKSPEENAPGSEILRYDLGWRAINEMLRSGRSLSGHERNCFFLNLGGAGSSRFADASYAVDADLDDDGRVLALADWDYDGDPDMWIANRSGPQLRYLRNDLSEGTAFVALRLQGTKTNRDAIGARVTITCNDGSFQTRSLSAGHGYLAQSSKWLHFGLGSSEAIASVNVSWPGGSSESFSGVTANSWNVLAEGTALAQSWEPPKFAPLVPSPLDAPTVGDGARVILLDPLPLPPLEGLASDIEHARLVTLWADWCAPCLKELKEWSALEQAFAAAKLDVVALNVSETEDMLKWQALNVPFTYRFGNQQLIEQFDVLQRAVLSRQRPLPLPSSFLIDTAGRLRAIYKGPVTGEQILKDVALFEKDRREILTAAMPLNGRWLLPPGGSSPTDLAIKFIDGGYSNQAEAYLNSLSQKPEYHTASIFNLLGALLTDRREFGNAASAFARALQIDPEDRQANIELGGLLLGISKGAEAETHFTRILGASPNDPELIFKLGVSQFLQNKLTEARDSLQRSIKLQPIPAALLYLAKTELASENVDAAIAAYEAGIQLQPALISASQTADLAEIAAAYGSVGRFAQAAELLSQATDRTPEIEKQIEDYRSKAHEAP